MNFWVAPLLFLCCSFVAPQLCLSYALSEAVSRARRVGAPANFFQEPQATGSRKTIPDQPLDARLFEAHDQQTELVAHEIGGSLESVPHEKN